MNVTRKIFYNKRNGQATLIIPSKVLKRIQKQTKLNNPIDKISFKILDAKEVKEVKVW